MVAHQWFYRFDGRAIGLNYPACESGWRLAGVVMEPVDFGKIRFIEAEILAALSDHEKNKMNQ